MSRYEGHYDYETSTGCGTIIVCIVLVVLFMLGFNACTASEWNGGNCQDCNVRYELQAVYDGLKYYACPECGNEVARYGGR